MVLLKGYFSTSEQANILKKCRDHGMGPVGFYEPRFREGGKLHLSLMCFGQFWDPEASKYVKNWPIDQAKPPSLPHEFLMLVERAIKDSHSLIAKQSKANNVEDILPPVVNYYTQIGQLSLHEVCNSKVLSDFSCIEITWLSFEYDNQHFHVEETSGQLFYNTY